MKEDKICRIATRKSPLALRQSEMVAELVRDKLGFDTRLLPMSTMGDRKMEWSLQKEGGKGLFTKELEIALLENRADLAVHSAKDMPTEMDEELSLSAFLEREDPRDVLVVREDLEVPLTLASGSPRRISQLKSRFPNIEWREMRGNVETRLKKIADDQISDGTILAAAGLKRLGICEFPGLRFEYLPTHEMVPAPGQASIAIQTRKDDRSIFSELSHPETSEAVTLERNILLGLGGGCQVALGAYSKDHKLEFFHENTGYLTRQISDNNAPDVIEELKSLVKK